MAANDPQSGVPPSPTHASVNPSGRARRRILGGVGVAAGTLALAAALNATGHNPLPGGTPLVGKNATSVFKQMQNDGLPITDGVPKDDQFAELVENNACKSSRSFVRTDSDTGWGIVCVKPPNDVYRRIDDAFDGAPLLMGPLYVDDGEGDVVVFGFGWPANASEQVFDAIGASGTYLTDEK